MLASVGVQVPAGCRVAASACGVDSFAEQALGIGACDHQSVSCVRTKATGNEWRVCGMLASIGVQVPASYSVAASACGVDSFAEQALRIRA